MRSLAIVVLTVAAACVGGCTTIGSTPATAPVTTAPAPTTTSTASSDVASTTTTESTTTTLDRLNEVTAIFTDLERRRLEAIYTGDVEAFTALFADTPYLDRSLEVFDVVEPGPAPALSLEVLRILVDDDSCLAVWSTTVVDSIPSDPATFVLEPAQGAWGIAYVSSEKGGWLCDGPHPLA
jgi:hypothetical protein